MEKIIEMLSKEINIDIILFYKTFKKEFVKELRTINATLLTIKYSNYNIDGLFKHNGNTWYFKVWFLTLPIKDDTNSTIKAKLMYEKVKHIDYNIEYKNSFSTHYFNKFVDIKNGMCTEMELV